MRGDTLVIWEASLVKVLVTANPHPWAKARAIISHDVVGGALARPKGLGNLTPQMVTEMSTLSISVV
eukprot:scaffold34653_cov254-Amphora_coffeaeformis.AAC.3